jgi:hypothetical protein
MEPWILLPARSRIKNTGSYYAPDPVDTSNTLEVSGNADSALE